MSLTGVAALIAAVSFAVLACAGVYLAVRFTRVLGDAATLVRETRTDQQALFARANAAVDRASAQLDRTEAATDGGGRSRRLDDRARRPGATRWPGSAGRWPARWSAVRIGRAAAVAYGVRHAVGCAVAP